MAYPASWLLCGRTKCKRLKAQSSCHGRRTRVQAKRKCCQRSSCQALPLAKPSSLISQCYWVKTELSRRNASFHVIKSPFEVAHVIWGTPGWTAEQRSAAPCMPNRAQACDAQTIVRLEHASTVDRVQEDITNAIIHPINSTVGYIFVIEAT
jgi:hypothetical protein